MHLGEEFFYLSLVFFLGEKGGTGFGLGTFGGGMEEGKYGWMEG
jgi:hypothetical protein